jgi:hypothetical protein
MSAQQSMQHAMSGPRLVERQIDQAETFLNALETDSLLSLNIAYKHEVEYDYTVYDQLSEDLIEIDVLKRYLRKHLQNKLKQLKRQVGQA